MMMMSMAERTVALTTIAFSTSGIRKIAGIDGGTEANGRRWLDHGFQFVSVTNDSWLVSNGGQAIVERLRRPA